MSRITRSLREVLSGEVVSPVGADPVVLAPVVSPVVLPVDAPVVPVVVPVVLVPVVVPVVLVPVVVPVVPVVLPVVVPVPPVVVPRQSSTVTLYVDPLFGSTSAETSNLPGSSGTMKLAWSS